MKRSNLLYLALAACGLCVTLGASPAVARPGGGSEGASLEETAAALRKKAAALREEGKVEDAEALEKKAALLEGKAAGARAEEARRAEVKARVLELQKKAEALKAEGREEEAKAAAKEAEELMRSLKGPKPAGGSPADLEKTAADLREKARALRERGSVEDADHLEGKAARLEKAAILRRESNDLEVRGKEAKAAGREDEARDLMERSGRMWKESEEVLAGPPKEKKPEGDLDAMKAEVEKLRRRIAELEEEIRRREGK